jgi:transcriptional regulator with XRE-family HTH domain
MCQTVNVMTRIRDDAMLGAFAAVLRSLREGLGWSQEKLALKAGVDRTFVGRLESTRHQPSLAVVFALAYAVGVTPSELVALVEGELQRKPE